MKIYDNKNPEGKKVDRPGQKVICPTCQGRDGRHVLVKTRKERKDPGARQTIVTYVNEMCPKA